MKNALAYYNAGAVVVNSWVTESAPEVEIYVRTGLRFGWKFSNVFLRALYF
jgi:hypothetical protein